MLLQYPALSNLAEVAHYEDYRRAHHEYMKVYKVLYEDVSNFSLSPERFIQEAEPLIERYLHKPDGTTEHRFSLMVISDFINDFYIFMDDATEMFTEHQLLARQTMKYMEKVSFLNRKNQDRFIRDCEDDYLQLMPDLDILKETLYSVKSKVDRTSTTLTQLRPVWERIKGKIAA